jgi:hypothetical protein
MATASPTAPPVQPDPDLQTGLQYLRAGWFDRAEPLFRSGPCPSRRPAGDSSLSRRLPVAARRAGRCRGAVAQGDRQGPQRADAVLQSRPGRAPDGPARTRRQALPRHHPPGPRPISRRGWRWPPSISTSTASPRPSASSPKWWPISSARGAARRRSAAAGPGAQPQHAGPRSLSPRPSSSRRSTCSIAHCAMPARRSPAGPDPGRPRARPGRPRPAR